jgi:regulator of protease activity HflC (stomatin/prohibitin superfamily)
MEARIIMMKIVNVDLDERVVITRRGLPLRALGPGRHLVWGFGLETRTWPLTPLVFDMPPELRTVLPADWFSEVTIGAQERGVLWRDGRPILFLGPGTHRYWEVDDTIRVQVFSVLDPMPELTRELAAVVPKDQYTDVIVREHERGLLHVQGRFLRVLAPGHYVFWSTRESPVDVANVDIRVAQVAVAGQELMTRDKVTLRLSIAVEYAIEDPAVATHTVANARDAVYLLVQLASREYVAGVTLDELLAGRDTMTRYLETDVIEKARRLGVRVERVGVKDVVLPGEMKTLLNKVIEAEKEAAANVILRREETAATRSLANTAKLMAEQPLLLRLKELDSLKEMAAKVHEVRLVVATHGMSGPDLRGLVPTGFFKETGAERES